MVLYKQEMNINLNNLIKSNMKKALIIIVLFLIQVQNSTVKCSTFLLEDSTKTEVRNSKIAVIFGTGIVGGVRFGGIYYFNNKVSLEMAYSKFGWEFLYGERIKQFSTIINYTPYNSKYFFASLYMSFRKVESTSPYELAFIPGFGFSSRLNRKGLGTYIRFGYGFLIYNINFDYFSSDYINHMGMPNIDLGIYYNF
jgi:uncharacterized membrane protein YciS (DUF1049 family)